MRIAKKQRRAVFRKFQDFRQAVAANSPLWLRRFAAPIYDYIDMIFFDHGIFRLIYPNRYRISDEAWRSSQPAPHQIAYFARKGVKTVINLRGVRDCGSYRLEIEACRKHGIEFVNLQLKSRAGPTVEVLHAVRSTLDQVEYPILVHCKSGADRVGMMGALYLFFRHGRDIAEAKEQLHWRYGHFRQADTGVLDYFFERYLEYRAQLGDDLPGEPDAFLNWAETEYDPAKMKQEFKGQTWANMLVNAVLRRE